jgi:methionyl-tRNA synthetase
MNVARLGNKYLADEEPWKMIKTDPVVQTQMYVACCGCLSSLCEPSCPLPLKNYQEF